ncbi:hypothetical protein [Brevibacillus fulvus]|uniref:Uncharacterized protein n=1 Tax=Brevibacillus fulvus TaxID=1125967 RepID=A0A938Y4W7_9BACL|nr:hypothetical protein [Brevibacillus fulvus]
MRDVPNRYRQLPPRTPEMLFNIIKKFYRGARNHVDFVQAKKQDVLRAYEQYQQTGESELLHKELVTLFLEFHFYTTCWLQIDLALYRLARMEQTRPFERLAQTYGPIIEKHVKVRHQLEQTERCVQAQWAHFGPDLRCVPEDRYWFDDLYFTVDQESVNQLNQLFAEAQTLQKELSFSEK